MCTVVIFKRTVQHTVDAIQEFVDLVPRVLRLLGQRVVAGRDYVGNEKIRCF